MIRAALILALVCGGVFPWRANAEDPRERKFETVLASLPTGPGCWSTVELNNLGTRVVTLEVEAHRSSGALAPFAEHPQVLVRLQPGEHLSYRLEIRDDAGDAWVNVREMIPSARFHPVVAATGLSECVAENKLHTSSRAVAYPLRDPWYSGDISEISGDVISLVNTSERPAEVSLCYSFGNLYSTPNNPSLQPVCSHTRRVQIPPFGAMQFPVRYEGSSHFDLKARGEAIVLEMLRPVQAGVRVYSVESTIQFGGEAR
jgi:hypothetical protein